MPTGFLWFTMPENSNPSACLSRQTIINSIMSVRPVDTLIPRSCLNTVTKLNFFIVVVSLAATKMYEPVDRRFSNK